MGKKYIDIICNQNYDIVINLDKDKEACIYILIVNAKKYVLFKTMVDQYTVIMQIIIDYWIFGSYLKLIKKIWSRGDF